MPTKPFISISNLGEFLRRECFYPLSEDPYIFRRERDGEIYPVYDFEGIVYQEDVLTSIASWKNPDGVAERFIQFIAEIEELD